MKKGLFLFGFLLLFGAGMKAQCTFVLPANTIVLTHDTTLNHCNGPVNNSYLLCGPIHVLDSSGCTSFVKYYVDSLATLEVDSSQNSNYAFIKAYVKNGATFDANFAMRSDSIVFTNGAVLIDTIPMYILNPGCLAFDYSLIGGNPCTVPTSTLAETTPAFALAPNPGTGHFICSGELSGCEYVIVNALGQVVQRGMFRAAVNEISLEQEPEGMYWIQLNRGESRMSRSFVIQR